ncbi:arp2/3 complex-activating protein rickA-like [Heracleum sosnowskyi]|uniref:Arp2/3 complex-activating protein rickA-like n=1 Tax=Heracleum sosnowskyi TaxID=360622 RepID=A0AAD8MQ87_9APIA|nr:arp2/3 complex-activating protein rickA-like [Heracleum sosnowskyi]KAK1380809.1 arp2/3 complex-activating protein rickA-like [Heracleum sosnowskyi]
MPSTLNQLIVSFILISCLHTSSSQTECPYPCYPSPPAGPGNYPPAGTLSPPSVTGGSFYPPPTGLLPNYPSPPYLMNGVTPPAPDSLVPWFPYYYKKPPHGTDQSSSSSLRNRTDVIGSTYLLVLLLFVSTFSHTLL